MENGIATVHVYFAPRGQGVEKCQMTVRSCISPYFNDYLLSNRVILVIVLSQGMKNNLHPQESNLFLKDLDKWFGFIWHSHCLFYE